MSPPAGWIHLADQCLLRVHGGDTERYLNGQLSNHLPDPSTSLAACITTHKGKLQAVVQVARMGDAFLLDAPAALAEELRARLERYIISDDVELEDATTQYALFHCFPASPRTLSIPAAYHYTSNRFGPVGLDLLIHRSQLAATTAALLAIAPMLVPQTIEDIRIYHGIARWGSELDDTILPPEAGLDRYAIDYHKGCYVGQEIISRIRSVGKVNRSLRLLLSHETLCDGTELFASSGPVGHVTSVAQSFHLDKAVALGYVKRGCAEPGTQLEARHGDRSISIIVQPLDFFHS